MEPRTDAIERNRASVRRWYAANREEYSALRRRRYKANPKLRAKARKAAAKYRRDRQRGLIQVRRTLSRTLNGVAVTVYTSGHVTDRIQCSPQVLRSWEERGWLPRPIFEGEKHRLYTAHQVGLIKLLADVARPKRGRRVSAGPVLSEIVDVIHKTWRVECGSQAEKVQDGRRRRR